MKMFGQVNYTVFYDMEHPEKLVSHLTELFLSNYPNPSKGARTAFSRVLHQYNLHSDLCSGRHCYLYHQNPAPAATGESKS